MTDKKLYKIPGLSKYLITEDGDIYSLYKQGYMKPDKDKDGYLHLKLKNDKKELKHYYIHRLVALVFIDKNLSDNISVRHKDKNKKNNNHTNINLTYKDNK
jgi:hypothetical protein